MAPKPIPKLTLETLRTQIEAGEIDTVLTCIVDMQGRLMGKRFHAEAFLEIAEDETHCCNYLLATDLEMATPDGYASHVVAARIRRLHHEARSEDAAPGALAGGHGDVPLRCH